MLLITMVNYQNGKIYKIVDKTNGNVYVLTRNNKKELCECGQEYTHANRARHFKTNKHLELMAAK